MFFLFADVKNNIAVKLAWHTHIEIEVDILVQW